MECLFEPVHLSFNFGCDRDCKDFVLLLHSRLLEGDGGRFLFHGFSSFRQVFPQLSVLFLCGLGVLKGQRKCFAFDLFLDFASATSGTAEAAFPNVNLLLDCFHFSLQCPLR